MKKIFLTGVVVILLIIIAADFYLYHGSANDHKSNAQAAIVPATATTDNNSAQDINDDIAPVATTATNDDVTVTRHIHRHAKHTIPVDESLADAGTPENIDADQDDLPNADAEVQKEYTGNMPVPATEKKPTFFHSTATKRSNFRFGPEGGILQNNFYKDNASKMGTEGFFAGVVADIGMGDHFYLQPGLRYERKGSEIETITTNTLMSVDTKDRIILNYVSLPVNLVVKFGDWHDVRFMIGAGPYISYLVSAQDKYETTTTVFNTAARTTAIGPNTGGPRVTTEQGHYSLPVGTNDASSANDMRRLDWGGNGFIGCEAPGGLFIKAGTEVGFMNIQHNTDGSYSNRNINFFASIGYLIGTKK